MVWDFKNGLSLGKRRKSDVVAPGTWILSVRSSQILADVDGWGEFEHAPDDYMFMGGGPRWRHRWLLVVLRWYVNVSVNLV